MNLLEYIAAVLELISKWPKSLDLNVYKYRVIVRVTRTRCGISEMGFTFPAFFFLERGFRSISSVVAIIIQRTTMNQIAEKFTGARGMPS